ncbi:MAG: sodium:dicarboxylate symporter [Planctomycetaceae bacterium]|nr:sodium:dicarboxylate symporter [Planctomycetaceae bacterium]
MRFPPYAIKFCRATLRVVWRSLNLSCAKNFVTFLQAATESRQLAGQAFPDTRDADPNSKTSMQNEPALNSQKRTVPLHVRILIGLFVGALCGLAANYGSVYATQQGYPRVQQTVEMIAAIAAPCGKVFLRLVFMVVIPLVFSALALGVAGMGDSGRLGRVGLKTFVFAAVLSTIAVLLGVGLTNLIRPGNWLTEQKQAELKEQYAAEAKVAEGKAKTLKEKKVSDLLLNIIPQNPLQEMVGAMDGSSPGGGILSVMFFSLIFGVALTRLSEHAEVMTQWLEGLQAVSMVIIGWAMQLAPFAVCCMVFDLTARLGLSILPPLFGFVSTVLLGLGIQMFLVYPIMLLCFTRRSPIRFFADISEAIWTAFGSSSSNATLPTALRVAQDKLRLPAEEARFVLTIGATGNQNGTALYEGVVVLFLAQVFHVELTVFQQFTVVVMSILAGIGTAGVPGSSLPMIVVVMTSVGVPGEGIGIILGIDRVLDMCRTVLNVAGDLTIAACVSGSHNPAENAV